MAHPLPVGAPDDLARNCSAMRSVAALSAVVRPKSGPALAPWSAGVKTAHYGSGRADSCLVNSNH